jgi:hypothetical protein
MNRSRNTGKIRGKTSIDEAKQAMAKKSAKIDPLAAQSADKDTALHINRKSE